MKRNSLLGLLVLVAACSAAESESDPTTSPDGGKGDVFETEVTECTFESPWTAETTADLDRFAGPSSTFTEADIESLDAVTADQLFEAVVHLGFLEEGERFDLLFSADDEGELKLIELTIEGVKYDWVKFYAGDTQVGVIFEDDTTDVVVEVSDGELWTCTTRPGPLMTDEPICSFDQVWRAETSSDLLEFSRSVENMDVLDGTLSRHKRQIIRAIEHLELTEKNGDIFDAFDAVDDERITVHELEFDNGDRFDWVKAYAGDTEIGVIFEREAALPLAEVSDGGVMGCTTIVSE